MFASDVGVGELLQIPSHKFPQVLLVQRTCCALKFRLPVTILACPPTTYRCESDASPLKLLKRFSSA